jgi:hypothetical protein
VSCHIFVLATSILFLSTMVWYFLLFILLKQNIIFTISKNTNLQWIVSQYSIPILITVNRFTILYSHPYYMNRFTILYSHPSFHNTLFPSLLHVIRMGIEYCETIHCKFVFLLIVKIIFCFNKMKNKKYHDDEFGWILKS